MIKITVKSTVKFRNYSQTEADTRRCSQKQLFSLSFEVFPLKKIETRVLGLRLHYSGTPYRICSWDFHQRPPYDYERKLNVRKTPLNAFCTFNLRPVSIGYTTQIRFWFLMRYLLDVDAHKTGCTSWIFYESLTETLIALMAT